MLYEAMEYQKVKSVSKEIVLKGPKLKQLITDTMQTIASIVGSTLGPGGQPVLIERQEFGLPVTITKDGVTVFRALGFTDPTQQCIMEAARDASVRTASEAGDGTTTATILADSLVRGIFAYVESNPKVSPQQVVRTLEKTHRDILEPLLKQISRKVDTSTEDGLKTLAEVATISANGDQELAQAVMKCFEICGDEGNVTISEVSGPSSFEVEHVKGYPIPMGYEESCGKMYPKFVNSIRTQQCILENPVFICYHGRLTDTGRILPLLKQIGAAWDSPVKYPSNVVLVATGFSDQVIADLAYNFGNPHSINVFPLLVPQSPIHNGQLHFLNDLCAITNADLFDPLGNPLETASIDRLGNVLFDEDLGLWVTQGVTLFEMGRFRGTVIGHADEDSLFARIDDLKELNKRPESVQDDIFMKERIAKLSGGIARLKVVGSSNGELKEKRDRAEDAVCAVRGAIREGFLPGGGWALSQLAGALPKTPINLILFEALLSPVLRLFENSGNKMEPKSPTITMLLELDSKETFDILAGEWVPIYTRVVDSTPAVREALKNALSIASVLGTLGGCVVFRRDVEFERSEAANTAQFTRDANSNEANNRA